MPSASAWDLLSIQIIWYRKLKVEERENVRMWAEATSLISVADTNQNVEFLSSIIDNNNTVPVILTDESDSIISARNFDAAKDE